MCVGDPMRKFTCHKYNGSSVVDYVLTDGNTLSQMKYFMVENLIGDLSDHCKISFALSLPQQKALQHTCDLSVKCSNRPPTRYKWHEDSSAKLKHILMHEENKEKITSLLQSKVDDIDDSIQNLNKLLSDTASKCLKPISSRKKRKSKPWYNIQCSKLKDEVRSLAKLVCKDPRNIHLRATFFTAKRNYKKIIKQSKSQFKQHLSKQLDNAAVSNSVEYWKILKLLKGSEKETNDNPISAEDWVKHFKELFKTPILNKGLDEKAIADELKHLENNPIFNELSFTFTEEEILNAISKLKLGKAPGPDSISSEIIKATTPIITPILVKLFNYIMSNGTYPKLWSIGLITPLLKKGSPFITDNYRGITVTSSLGKVFGIVMNSRLETFCVKHSIIDDRQASHKKGARTSDNVFIIRSLFEKYCIEKKGKLFTCFVDFRKAFDSIWHQALFLKLQKQQIGGPFYNILKNMYNDITSAVKLNGNVTENFSIQSGVRQGDILSPLLFNIFVNDIIQEFDRPENHPPSLIEQNVGCLLYADDLVIMSTSAEGLQNSINNLAKYCTKWKLEINMSKTKTICFKKSNKKENVNFQCNGCNIENVDSYSYLGIEISSNGSFKPAEKCLFEKAQKATFKLKGLLSQTSLKPFVCLRLFDQLIKPICMYGSEIWGIDCIKCDSSSKFNESLEKFLCEKLNMSFSKYTLGVHKKAQNTAVRGELA